MNKNTVIQLDRFRQSLVEAGYADCPELKSWFKAFDALKVVIRGCKAAKKVVFIDEMPWLDRPNANFVSALENFWNAWASARKDVLLIACGSASSWILRKIVHNNVCEMKFSDGEFEITKKDHEAMRNRIRALKEVVGAKKAVHTTFVTACGLKYNAYANDVQSQVVLDDLFKD